MRRTTSPRSGASAIRRLARAEPRGRPHEEDPYRRHRRPCGGRVFAGMRNGAGGHCRNPPARHACPRLGLSPQWFRVDKSRGDAETPWGQNTDHTLAVVIDAELPGVRATSRPHRAAHWVARVPAKGRIFGPTERREPNGDGGVAAVTAGRGSTAHGVPRHQSRGTQPGIRCRPQNGISPGSRQTSTRSAPARLRMTTPRSTKARSGDPGDSDGIAWALAKAELDDNQTMGASRQRTLRIRLRARH
jgi:hypothetical protein